MCGTTRWHSLLPGVFLALAISSCQPYLKPRFSSLVGPLFVQEYTGTAHKLLIVSNAALEDKVDKSEVNKNGLDKNIIDENSIDRNRANQNNLPQAYRLNIYLEGDGKPWINERYINNNPSPVYPLGLHLMSLDRNPALYVARPCYNIELSKACRPELWTNARYSQEIVDAMAEAIEYQLNTRLKRHQGSPEVTLIGYSGGGTLALLLAQQLEHIQAVLTVAGNLDTDAWTSLHDYSPLTESINPASISLRSDLSYHHLLGGKDRNIPPNTGLKVHSRAGHNQHVYRSFGHSCCWAENWPDILAELQLISP